LATIGLLLVTILTAQESSAADPPVHGDLKLLEVLRDAQRGNESLYPHGDIRVHLEIHVETPPDTTNNSVYDIHSEWNGADLRAEIQGDMRFHNVPTISGKTPPGTKPKEDSEHRFHTLYVVSDGVVLTHFVDQPLATVHSTTDAGPMLEARVTPKDWWFGNIRSEGRPWIEMLGPHPRFPQDLIKEYDVKALDDRRVEVLRTDKNGGTVRMISDLNLGGNVVEVESSFPSQYESRRYQWEASPSGRYLLRTCVVESVVDGDKAKKTYQLISFDPAVVPDASRFDTDTSRLPPGTSVADGIKNTNYRIGPPRAFPVAASLDSLVERARSRGFASPFRK
jgi:hypothetical protein